MSGLPYQASECTYYITSSALTFTIAMSLGFIPYFFTIYYYVKLIRISNEYEKDSLKLLQSRNRIINSKDDSSGQESSGQSFIQSIESTVERTIRQEKQAKRVKRAARMLGLIMAAYSLSTYPSFCVYLIYSFLPQVGIENTIFFYAYPWLNFSNSAANPWIYFAFTKDLRKSTIDLIRSHTAWYDSTNL